MYILIELDKTKDKGIIKSDYLPNIREHFSEEDEKAGLKKAIFKSKSKYISSRKYIITESGRFEIGLVLDIVKYLKSLNTPFKVVFSDEFKARYTCMYPFAKESLIDLHVPLRDYQKEGVTKALANGNGIEVVPTAGGKTIMMASLIHTIITRDPNTKVLLITLTHLIDQIYEEFIDYGMDPTLISRWSGDHPLDPHSPIVICDTTILYSKIDNTALELKKAKVCYLTLQKNIKNDLSLLGERRVEQIELSEKINKDITRLEKRQEDNKPVLEFLRNRSLLIIDEIHTLRKDNEINNVLKFIKTRNRYGFTGTMPESLIDQWNIIGKIGPIIYEVSRELLVEQKHIADTDVRIVVINYKDNPESCEEDLEESTSELEEFEELGTRYEKELQFIRKSPFRNHIIKKLIDKVDKNVLIVLDRIEHGEELKVFLMDNLKDKEVYFIKGDVEDEVRTEIRKLMEESDNIVCIAISKIFSVGVNIKNLHYIIFAAAGKAKVRTVQTIGRGVRMLAGKVKVVIFDLADNLHYGRKHLEKRKEIYDKENMQYKCVEVQER